MQDGVQGAVRESVDALVELLRGLGGESSAADVKAEVRCQVSLL